MRKIGFLDLRDGWDDKEKELSIYVFKSSQGRFEFEKTIKHTSSGAPDWKSDNIKGYYLSLPLNLLNFRVLKLPFSDRERLKKVIPFELDGLILGGTDSIVFDTIKLNGEDVLVTYIEKIKLAAILTKLSSFNFDPSVVTSIELHNVISRGAKNIIQSIINPEKLTDDARINAAGGEISSNLLNLRTGSLAYTKETEKIKKTLNVTAALSILLASLIVMSLVFRLVTEMREASSIKKELKEIYTNLFPEDKKIADELYQMKSHIKNLKEKGDALAGIYPLRFLAGLSQGMTHGVVFNEINLDKDLVTIKGEALSMDNIGKMKAMLSEIMTNVSVDDIKPSAEGKLLFTVSAKITGHGGG